MTEGSGSGTRFYLEPDPAKKNSWIRIASMRVGNYDDRVIGKLHFQYSILSLGAQLICIRTMTMYEQLNECKYIDMYEEAFISNHTLCNTQFD